MRVLSIFNNSTTHLFANTISPALVDHYDELSPVHFPLFLCRFLISFLYLVDEMLHFETAVGGYFY